MPHNANGEQTIDALYDKENPDEFDLSFCGRGGPEAIKKYSTEYATSANPEIQSAIKVMNNPDSDGATVDKGYMTLYEEVKKQDPNKAALMLLEFTSAIQNPDGSLTYLNALKAEEMYKKLTGNPNASFDYFSNTRYGMKFSPQSH